MRIKIIKNRHRQRIRLIRRLENSGGGIVGRADVATTGAETVPRKKVDTRTTPLFVTVWKEVIKIVSDSYEEQQVEVLGLKITPI